MKFIKIVFFFSFLKEQANSKPLTIFQATFLGCNYLSIFFRASFKISFKRSTRKSSYVKQSHVRSSQRQWLQSRDYRLLAGLSFVRVLPFICQIVRSPLIFSTPLITNLHKKNCFFSPCTGRELIIKRELRLAY